MRILRTNSRYRLAITYLAIIMTLSLVFSIMFYNQSLSSAEGGLRRQADEFYNSQQLGPRRLLSLLDEIREREYSRFKEELVLKLLFLNITMLTGGGLLSVFLAKKSLEPLEKALEAQSRFSSDVAHELRTPLTSMQSEIEVAIRDKNLSPKDAKVLLGSVLDEIHNIDSLTTALLRLSTNETTIVNYKKVKLSEVLLKAQDRVAKLGSKKNIVFVFPKGSYNLKGDFDLLVELFVTLFDNAIKYSQNNTIVRVNVKKHHHQLVVEVIDEGIGIPESSLPYIFDRFYRVDESRGKKDVSGFGLGLSLAKDIAESHGGSIECSSTEGKGTAFSVNLPTFEAKK